MQLARPIVQRRPLLKNALKLQLHLLFQRRQKELLQPQAWILYVKRLLRQYFQNLFGLDRQVP